MKKDNTARRRHLRRKASRNRLLATLTLLGWRRIHSNGSWLSNTQIAEPGAYALLHDVHGLWTQTESPKRIPVRFKEHWQEIPWDNMSGPVLKAFHNWALALEKETTS